MTATVASSEDLPTLTFPDSLAGTEDDTIAVALDGLVLDPDTDLVDLIWSFSGAPELHTSLDASAGNLDIWADENANGSYRLIVQVEDPAAVAVHDTVVIELAAINDPPQFESATVTLLQNTVQLLDLAALTTDPDDDPASLVWTADGDDNIEVTLDTVDVARIQPDSGYNGDGTIAISVTDTTGAQTLATIAVRVLQVNSAPVLAALPDTVAAKGDSLVIDLLPFASDVDVSEAELSANLFWTVTGARLATVAVDGSSLVLAAPTSVPAYAETLEVRVTDTFGLAAETTLTVGITNQPPLFANLPDTLLAKGDSLRLDMSEYAVDPDDAGAQLTLSHGDAVAAEVELEDDVLVIRAPVGLAAYAEQIDLQVVDSSGATGDFTLAVAITNRPPQLAAIPDTFAYKGEELSLNIAAFASDPDDPVAQLSFTVAQAQQVAATIEDGLLLLQSSVLISAHTETLTIRALDSSGGDAEISLVVDILNRAPDITGLPDLLLTSGTGETLNLDDFVEDDGPLDSLSWILNPPPELQVVFHADSRTATVTPIQGFAGPTQIEIVVTDGEGASTNDTTEVFVMAPTDGSGTFHGSGDLNGDSITDFFDLFVFVDAFSSSFGTPNWDPDADLDRNGIVDIFDLFVFADQFGKAASEQPTALLVDDIPDLTMELGRDISLNLSDFVLSGDADQIVWAATGMVFTTVAIDPASQVANISANPLDAGTDLLRFTARDSEGREASDLVTVDVVNAATSFRLALPAELTVRANRTTSLSLDNFVSSSEFAASEFNWTISTSVGLQALIRDRVAFVAGDADFTGSAELFLTASSPSGEALTGSVAVIVTP